MVDKEVCKEEGAKSPSWALRSGVFRECGAG